jgi:hypothetical protein
MSIRFISRRHAIRDLAGLLSAGLIIPSQGSSPARAAPPGDATPLKAPGRGTLKGRVVWQGRRPDLTEIDKELKQALQRIPPQWRPKDGRIEQQVWHISHTGGLRDVMVFLIPPAGSYFPLDKGDLDPQKARWRKEVVIEAVGFSFRPNQVVLFPRGFDADGRTVATGQVFKLRVTDREPYALNLQPTTLENPSRSWLLPPGKEQEAEIVPSRLPVCLQCQLHRWMRGWVWAYDHPYAVMTDWDGNFEIPNVPAGVKVQVQAWHAQTGWLSPKGRVGDTIEVPVGKVLEHRFTARLID